MAEPYFVQSLLTRDGTWQAMQDDWRQQCETVGEPFEDYAPDVTQILAQIADERVEQTQLTRTSVCAFREGEAGPHWAIAMLNWVRMLPGTDAPTLRVRHLTVSPRLDFGEEPLEKYAEVLIGAVSGVIHLSNNIFEARNLRFHLRSPEDINFFRALGSMLVDTPFIDTVETRGAWLYMTRPQRNDDEQQNG